MSKKVDHNGCVGCKYESKTPADMPCRVCNQNYVDKYKPMPKPTNFEVLTESVGKLADFLLLVDASGLESVVNFCKGHEGCKEEEPTEADCKRCLIKYLLKESKEV